MDGVILTPLNIISGLKGDVLHIIKKTSVGYSNFSEAYFSTVHAAQIKGWKKHSRMTVNLVVPTGEVRFAVYDGDCFFNVNLSQNNYNRLTISPGLWFAFKGVSQSTSVILNVTDIEHDDAEVESCSLDKILYEW